MNRDYTAGTVNITQERYLYKATANQTQTYWVPINYATKKEDFATTDVAAWIDKDAASTVLNFSLAKDKWVVFNKQHFGKIGFSK